MATIIEVIAKFTDQVSGGLRDLGKSLEQVGERAQAIGGKLTTGVTLPLAGIGGAAVAAATEFERNMVRTVTLAGVAESQMQSFRQSILDLAPAVGIGPGELSRGLLVVTSTGLRGAQAMEVLTAAAKASAVGLGDVKDVARAITAALVAYGDENLSAAKAADVLFAAVREGGAEADQFAGALGRVIGISAQVGVSFGETAAFVATFTRLGISADEAVTALRGVLSTVLKPTKEAQLALRDAGLSIDGLRAAIIEKGLTQALLDLVQRFEGNTDALATVIPNVRALAGVLGTAGSQAEGFADVAQKVTSAIGDIDQAATRTGQTTGFAFARLSAQAQVVAVQFGDVLAPSLLNVLGAAQPLLDVIGLAVRAFAALPQPLQTVVLATAALAAVVGPVTFLIGGLIKAAGAASVLFGSTLPVAMTILARGISAAGVAFPVLGTALTKLGAVATGLAATGLKPLLAALGPAGLVGASAVAGFAVGKLIGNFLLSLPIIDDFTSKLAKAVAIPSAQLALPTLPKVPTGVAAQILPSPEDTRRLTAEQKNALAEIGAAASTAALEREKAELAATGNILGAIDAEFRARVSAIEEEARQRQVTADEANVSEQARGVIVQVVADQIRAAEVERAQRLRDLAAQAIQVENDIAQTRRAGVDEVLQLDARAAQASDDRVAAAQEGEGRIIDAIQSRAQAQAQAVQDEVAAFVRGQQERVQAATEALRELEAREGAQSQKVIAATQKLEVLRINAADAITKKEEEAAQRSARAFEDAQRAIQRTLAGTLDVIQRLTGAANQVFAGARFGLAVQEAEKLKQQMEVVAQTFPALAAQAQQAMGQVDQALSLVATGNAATLEQAINRLGPTTEQAAQQMTTAVQGFGQAADQVGATLGDTFVAAADQVVQAANQAGQQMQDIANQANVTIEGLQKRLVGLQQRREAAAEERGFQQSIEELREKMTAAQERGNTALAEQIRVQIEQLQEERAAALEQKRFNEEQKAIWIEIQQVQEQALTQLGKLALQRAVGAQEGLRVPGPLGAPRRILAHGGELILNPQQEAAVAGAVQGQRTAGPPTAGPVTLQLVGTNIIESGRAMQTLTRRMNDLITDSVRRRR